VVEVLAEVVAGAAWVEIALALAREEIAFVLLAGQQLLIRQVRRVLQ